MEPAAPAQEEIWLSSALEREAPLYTISIVLELEGRLNLPLLQQTLSLLVARHEVLRTTYHPRLHGLQMQVNEPCNTRIALCDLSRLDVGTGQTLARSLRNVAASLNLQRGPIFDARIVKHAGDSFTFIFSVHHIAIDGWSMGIFARDLESIHCAYLHGERPALDRLALRYADFARTQKERVAAKLSRGEFEPLRERFRLPALKLDIDKSCPPGAYWQGDCVRRRFAPRVNERLVLVGRQVKATQFVILTAVLWMVLHAHSRSTSFLMASDYANRADPESGSVIGLFAGQLLLKGTVDRSSTFVALIKLAQRELQHALLHADCPVSALLPAMSDVTGAPPFRVKLAFQPRIDHPRLTGLKVVSVDILSQWAKFDLLFSVSTDDRGAAWELQYRRAMFERSDMTALLEEVEQLTSLALAQPESPVASLIDELLSLRETSSRNRLGTLKQQLLGTVRLDARRSSEKRAALTQSGKLSGAPADRICPWVVQARVQGVSLRHWVAANKASIEHDLAEHRAVLFRDFHIGAAEFPEIASELIGDLMSYVEGATPRAKKGPKTYSSTLFPPDEEIGLHNELSSAMTFPSRIAFYCARPAARGGETPLADVQQVYSYVPQDVAAQFATHGWMLVRNFHKGFGLSWQQAFETQDRRSVEDYCASNEIAFQWRDDGNLRLQQVRPAVMNHPVTGRPVWFNHVAFWHESSLPDALRAMLFKEFGRDGLPFNTYYGDGNPIATETIDAIRGAYRRARTSFGWRSNDLLYLDNIGIAHGRTAYTGERELLVSMGRPYRRSQLS